jgi:hypothetical protein
LARSSLDSINKQLLKEKEKAEVLAEAWRKVSYEVKKDGTPYKNVRKTLSGASYRRIPYAFDPYHNELDVHAWGAYGNKEDTIPAYTDHISECKKPENIHEGIYVFDLNDIKDVVAERTRYWTARGAGEWALKNRVETRQAYNEKSRF